MVFNRRMSFLIDMEMEKVVIAIFLVKIAPASNPVFSPGLISQLFQLRVEGINLLQVLNGCKDINRGLGRQTRDAGGTYMMKRNQICT